MTRQLSAEPTIKLDNDAKWSSDTAPKIYKGRIDGDSYYTMYT